MPYTTPATARTLALVILLIDESGSMSDMCGSMQRIQAVSQAVLKMLERMVTRSMRGTAVSPRYRLAMFAYNHQVKDLLNGILPIDQVARMKPPVFDPEGSTNTAEAFKKAEELLQKELPRLAACPAPLVAHLTDAEFTGSDPSPIVERIKQMGNRDGAVLVENIFISDNMLKTKITDPKAWKGLTDRKELRSEVARRLFDWSSPLPDSYRAVLQDWGYTFDPKARMMLPGMSPELVELGFAMSAATPTVAAK